MLDVEEVLVHVKVVVPVEIRGLHTSRFDDDMIAIDCRRAVFV